VGPSEDDETFLLWGDSHAGALGPLVEHEALTHNYAGALAFRPACAPVLQVRYSSSRFDTRFEPCDGFRDSVLDYVASHHIKNIFLHARWGWYTEEPETAPNSGPERKLAEFERLLRITLGQVWMFPRHFPATRFPVYQRKSRRGFPTSCDARIQPLRRSAGPRTSIPFLSSILTGYSATR